MIKCVIALVGEAEVPANRCSRVLKIVGEHLFHERFKQSDLPSERSALRFADRGHFLAKYQVGERL
jgi:hypothetical protein